MSIKFRLTAMQFLQFFVWGAWLISLGGYMGGTLHFEGGQIGAIFATMGIASLIMPGLTGIIADKWINAERLYGILHLIGAGALIYASTATTYNHMYWAMLLNMLVYMPTLSLANTVSYNALEKYKMDLIKDFPPIRVWGTVGFICAMWAVDLTGFKASSAQLYVAAISAAMLGLYAFTLPACPPMRSEGKTMLSAFGLDALVLFKRKKMAIFFLFSMLLGAALQITNTYGDLFLGSFASIPEYADSFGVKHSVILLSISQMSETLFILAIPFFLKHFGIKRVMLISMFAWVFRFGLFALGDPGSGLWMLILSMIVYGMAFDFFIGLAVYRNGSTSQYPCQRTRLVLHDDERCGSHHRRLCQRSRGGCLLGICRRRRTGKPRLDTGMVYLCRICLSHWSVIWNSIPL